MPLPSTSHLLRIAHTGGWTNRGHEFTFHLTFALLHACAVPLHVGGVLHHGSLALKGLWRR